MSRSAAKWTLGGHLVESGLAVLFGGTSPEHEVSLSSGSSILTHAERLGWDVLAIGISKDGRWLVGPGALPRLMAEADPRRLPGGGSEVPPIPAGDEEMQSFSHPPPALLLADCGLAFPVCHGRWGEDGALQGLLESHRIPVIGSGVAASAVCFDKHLARSVLAGAGLPVARGLRVDLPFAATTHRGALLNLLTERLGPMPWFAKPVRGGSSLGIGRIDSLAQVGTALAEVARWDTAALVEEFVPHREMVMGVIGIGDLQISPPGECVAVGELYTYEEKYELGNPRFRCPAPLDPVLTERARELAARAYRALGCNVFARVDLFLDYRSGDFLVNEVNTIPGMTEFSVFPKIMREAGYSYPELLTELRRVATEGRKISA